MSLILQMSLKHFPRDQNFQDLPSLDIGFGKVVARSSSNSEAPKVDSSGASIPETKDDAALVLLTSEELTQLNAIKELARVGLQARDRLNDRKRFLSIIQALSRGTSFVDVLPRGGCTVTLCHRVARSDCFNITSLNGDLVTHWYRSQSGTVVQCNHVPPV